MANLRDKLRGQPEKPSGKGSPKNAKVAPKAKPKKGAKAAPEPTPGLLSGLDVNRKLLLASGGIALVAGLVAISYLSDLKSGIAGSGQKVKVYVVSQGLPARKQLTADMVSTVEIPRVFLPDGALTDEKDVVGKITLAPVAKGEILSKVRVSDASQETGVTPKLHPNERGFLFQPNGANDIALVKPDDYVDLTATIQTQSGGLLSTKVAQRVRVLSIGNRFSSATPAEGTETYGDLLTLAVPADKVALLAALKQQGNLTIALREQGDTTITPPEIPEKDLVRYVMGHIPPPQQPVQHVVRPVVVHPVVAPHPHVEHPHPVVVHHPKPVDPPPQHTTGVDVYVGTTQVHKKQQQ
jgi:Flp pilus assembly protein CpaB